MALLIEKYSSRSYVIGVNAQGELGLGDRKQRKTLEPQADLKGKQLSHAAVGRSGFVVALSRSVIKPSTSGTATPEIYPNTMENTQYRTQSVELNKSD